MTIKQLRVDQIRCGPRQRQVDAGKVADIAKSIEQLGLLQAIGVRPRLGYPGHYEVVFGAHRLAAMIMLEQEMIAAYVLPTDLLEEEYLLMELQENCARNDLTGAQLKAFAAEVGRLLDILFASGHADNVHGFWLDELSSKIGVDRRTLLRWWQAFCDESGLRKTPRQATEADKQHFYDWLEAQKIQEDAAKQQQADARRLQIQYEECESAINHLTNMAQTYGVEVVETQVIVVFQERFGRTSPA